MATITSINEFTGKLGNMVGFKKKDGTYGIRAYQRKPHNPRTTPQMTVRVSIANLVAFWRALLNAAHPNFTNKEQQESDYNAFVQANYGINPVFLKKSDVRAGACLASAYQISRGSLPTIGITAVSGGKMKSDIALDDLSIGAETKVSDLAKAIVQSNGNRFQEFDMLTIFYAQQLTEGDQNIPHVSVKALRIPLDFTDNTLVSDLENGDIIGVTDGFLSSKSTVNGGFTIVHTRLVDGQTEVSSQTISVNNNLLALYTGTSAMQAAILSYGGARDPFLRPFTNASVDLPVEP